ncbi:MAG: hypothetical protein ACHQAZ_02020 [Gammaproteobacteria bacterium]
MKIIFGDYAGSLIPILSLIVTLISVIVGPLVAFRIAKRQIHASVVSSTRQQWISSLRDLLAEFLTLVNHISAVNGIGHTDDGHIEKVQKLILLLHKLRLFLDPAEKINQDLIKKAEEMRSTAFHSTPATSVDDAMKIGILSAEFIVLAQAILKHEKVVVEMEIDSQ